MPTEHLNGHHTIFGQCDEPSINVVRTIAHVRVNAGDKAVEPVTLKKITVAPEGQAAPPLPSTPSAPTGLTAKPQP